MKFPRTLMIVIDHAQDEPAALSRGLKFAEQGNMSIHLFSAVYAPVTEMTEVLTRKQCADIRSVCMAERQSYLKQLSARVEALGIRCDTSVVWQRRLPEAIETAVKHVAPDLVIKSISAEQLHPLAMPNERHLLRYCQAPLLLVRKAQWSSAPVLAAIDPLAPSQVHQQLSHSVLQCAQMVGHLLHADWHVVYAQTSISGWKNWVNAGILSADNKADIEHWQRQKLDAMLADYEVAPSQVHLVNGDPDIQIPAVVNQIGAQLVTMGTVGACDLDEGYIGNTAERIMAQLRCDVLALEPDQLRHAEALL